MKNKFFILIACCFCLTQTSIFAQNNSDIADTTIYYLVDKEPILIFDNKEYKLENTKGFIHAHLKYPKDGPDCIGSAIISIVVEKDGTFSNKKLLRKLPCDNYNIEAMNVIDLMREWKPGVKKGKTVRTFITLKVKWNE